ncbi:MAG: hypothetical protein J5757_09010 [Lachnospiraceae bacterium]|nr:hypothetical protein [Lachnospiraceae bacterium]
MFVTCPNCKELVGNHVGPCPMCKNMITAEYISKCEQEMMRESAEDTREKMTVFHDRKVFQGVFAFALIVAMLTTTFICYMVNREDLIVDFEFAELVIFLILVRIFKCIRCPYCNKYYMGFPSRWSHEPDHCVWCGGRLR